MFLKIFEVINPYTQKCILSEKESYVNEQHIIRLRKLDRNEAISAYKYSHGDDIYKIELSNGGFMICLNYKKEFDVSFIQYEKVLVLG